MKATIDWDEKGDDLVLIVIRIIQYDEGDAEIREETKDGQHDQAHDNDHDNDTTNESDNDEDDGIQHESNEGNQ